MAVWLYFGCMENILKIFNFDYEFTCVFIFSWKNNYRMEHDLPWVTLLPHECEATSGVRMDLLTVSAEVCLVSGMCIHSLQEWFRLQATAWEICHLVAERNYWVYVTVCVNINTRLNATNGRNEKYSHTMLNLLTRFN